MIRLNNLLGFVYSGTFNASTMLIFLFFLATSHETKKETPNIKTTGMTNVI